MPAAKNPKPIIPPADRPAEPDPRRTRSDQGRPLFGQLRPRLTCRYVDGFLDAEGFRRRTHPAASCSVECYRAYASRLVRALNQHLRTRIGVLNRRVVVLYFRGYLKFRPSDSVAAVRRRFVKQLNRKRPRAGDCSVFAIRHATTPTHVHYDYIALGTNTSLRAVRTLLRSCWCGATRRPFQISRFEGGRYGVLHAVCNYLPYLTKLYPEDRAENWRVPRLGSGQRLTMRSGPLFNSLRIDEDAKLKG